MPVQESLEINYRRSFGEFTRQVDALQRLTASGSADRERLEAVCREVEDARQAYNRARDLLAQAMAASSPAISPQQEQVRRTAQRLWELNGRPRDTQENDWHEAERLIQAKAR